VTIKHATASTFVFSRLDDGGWRIGLILHPLFGKLMIPGGHIEPEENAPEAARREVAEETGLAVTFVPALAATVPAGLSSRKLVSPPWWILEQPVESDNHLAEPHFHVDHLYVAVATVPEPLSHPAHPFSWHDQAELAALTMFDDTRQLATALFADIEAIGAGVALADGR
jgi:8-oxo-dGTP pyrophosphatase MutT (NUDIX family)